MVEAPPWQVGQLPAGRACSRAPWGPGWACGLAGPGGGGLVGHGRRAWVEPDHVTPTLNIFSLTKSPLEPKWLESGRLTMGETPPKPKARTTPIVKTTFSKISVRLNAFLIRHDPGRVGEYV